MARLGMSAKLYRSETLLTGADPEDASGAEWIEIPEVRDVTSNDADGEADITTRANNGFRQTLATLTDAGIDFEMIWDLSNANYLAVRNAKRNRTPIAMACMTGDITEDGNEGFVGNWSVVSMNRSEPLEDAIKVAITIKPYDNTQVYVVGEESS